jgi:RHS repeat-associated protein
LWGNRLTIDEPNAGLITSEYNKFNELVKQTDAKGNIITYQYDLLGRVTQKKYADSKNILTLDYIYDNAEGKGKGKLALIKKDHIKAKEFTYDNYGRLIKDMNFDGAYRFEYTYTPNGQLNTMTYPGGFSITYNYTPAGKLKTIRRSSDNSLIYEVSARNEFGATRLCQFGNGLATEYSYDRYGLLTDIQTGNKVFVPEEEEMHPKGGGGIPGIYTTDASILNYNYTYNTRGIMSSRSESIINQQETFTYDNLDRLTGFRYSYPGEPSTTKNFTYHDNGNILANDKLGSYYYSNTQKHAVTQIMPINQNVISQNECAVDYNFFNQPTQIEEGDTRLDISYGINQQRNKAVKSVNKEVTNVHYYGNKYYEGEVDHFDDTTSIRRHYHYIYGDRGVVAMYLTTRTGKDTASMEPDTLENPTIPVDKSIITTDSMYYIHTDHLGSYCAITSSAKQIVQRNWFDPWGNYQIRYDTIFSKKPQPTIIENNFTLTNRGFTGHEHYPYFKIINMNGRLYDPVIGRFFSPDKFVANSSFTQDFNRYSYCRNNPLSYTDPSGEFLCMIPALVIGAAWCAIMGGIEGQKHGATGWNMAAYIIGGAAIGAVSALGAYGIGIGCATAGFGAVTGMVSGGLSGLMSGTINGVGMAALAGKSSKDIYYSTLSGGLMGMGMGAFFGGISDIGNAVASRAGAISNINNAVINGGGYRGESGEMGGGNDIGSIFLDETIPPGACPTRTGEIATTTTNPNYGKYGWTRSGGKQAHYGIDYYGEVGDSVRSMYNGVVERIGAGPKLGKHCVTISSDIGGTTYKVQYGHLSRALVIQNQEVAAGDIIGLMGRVGIPNAYPTHVHIQIWRQMVIQGVTYRGFVQPSWNWIPSSTIPWQYRLYY